MKNNIRLTKQQAIEGHRKMWNWIVDEIERKKCLSDIFLLKQNYCCKNNFTLENYCFCCEYTKHSIKCTRCPLDWIETSDCYVDTNSLYHKVLTSRSWKEQADLARQIANLPERKDIE